MPGVKSYRDPGGSYNINLEMFRQPDVLNLFSDASMNRTSACYGSVAVCQDTIIDEKYRMQNWCTVPAAELRGIRCSLSLALKWRHCFRVINIFSDSQLNIYNLRDYIYRWRFDSKKQMFFGATEKGIKNIGLILEDYTLLEELRKTNIVNLYHQLSHIDSGFGNIKHCAESFKEANKIPGIVDLNFARYISVYNNYVDEKTRAFAKMTDFRNCIYSDAIDYVPLPDGRIYGRK